jgi:hypothetical protein
MSTSEAGGLEVILKMRQICFSVAGLVPPKFKLVTIKHPRADTMPSRLANRSLCMCCLSLLACASSRQPVHQQHARQPTQGAAGGTHRRGGGPSAAHRRLDAEHAVRVFVYGGGGPVGSETAPVAPFRRPFVWRFQPLIDDLTAMGIVTRNMSEAHVFLIVNYHESERSDDKAHHLIALIALALTLTLTLALLLSTPTFTWPCNHREG